MSYNIFSKAAPVMPGAGKGTEVCKLLLSQASSDMREALLPMALVALSAHVSEVEFLYPDGRYHELCGQMGHLVAASGVGKGQLTPLVEALMRSFRAHDKGVYESLAEWARQTKTRAANKPKPERPEAPLWFPPADMTHPFFIQNAMALESQGGRTQYLNLPEVEMADRLCGGHRNVSQIIRNIYDRERAGQVRATADGVTGEALLRVSITMSSTPLAARRFYKNDLLNGLFGRIAFAYRPRTARTGCIPRQGRYEGEWLDRMDVYLERLARSKGRFIVPGLNKTCLALSEEMARLADKADDDLLYEISHRSVLTAWKKGALLWLLHSQEWTRSIARHVEWFCHYDLWSKLQIFGDMLQTASQDTAPAKTGPSNMLDDLPRTFHPSQLESLRTARGKAPEGTDHQLAVWKSRGFISYSKETGMYTKVES
ncbi:MAG: DUF3987 domain-containing protein [Bacteroidaceae bacterium]|nr:DUF3987 domain-containing protein [Bacteroidaceae bacterium]